MMRALVLLALAAARHGDEFHVGAGGGEPRPVKDAWLRLFTQIPAPRRTNSARPWKLWSAQFERHGAYSEARIR